MREAYRKRGWALLDMDKVEQCHREGFKEELEQQRGEGCHMWGTVHINKVRVCLCCCFCVGGRSIY